MLEIAGGIVLAVAGLVLMIVLVALCWAFREWLGMGVAVVVLSVVMWKAGVSLVNDLRTPDGREEATRLVVLIAGQLAVLALGAFLVDRWRKFAKARRSKFR